MDKRAIAQLLHDMGTLLELKGENPFRVRAYYNAARTIETTTADLQALFKAKKLSTLKGIGKGIAEIIAEYITTGEVAEYKALKESVPPGLVEMLEIQGLGPKKVMTIYTQLGISTLGELEYACQENRLVTLEGFGQKTQEKILQGILYRKKNAQLYLYPEAFTHATPLFEALAGHKAVLRTSLGGSLRRRKEVVKDIDLLASSNEPHAVMEFFTTRPEVAKVLQRGETKSSVLLEAGIQADLRIVTDTEYPYALHHFTGSKEHNTVMRRLAKSFSLTMNEYGLFHEETQERIVCKDETDIFQALGLHYIPPELRENMGEIEAAQQGTLPHLVEESDLKGIFHVHTYYSDGVDSLETMARAAQKLGYTYIGIADHSQTARYANGLTVDRIREQWREIEHWNTHLSGITLLKGIELEILPDGSLDTYPDEILAGFDFIIASVHSRFTLSEAEMTKRILKALQHPYVTMLGHPSGRLLLAREPYPVNLRAIIEVAAAEKKVIEINANPHRLDLNWQMCKYAKEQGVKLAINPDAHRVEGLTHTQYGIYVARRGWLEASDILNTFPLPQVQAWLTGKGK